jgi:hypothetical protein
MKLFIAPLIFINMIGCTHWYVQPAPNGKWRSCAIQWEWDGGTTACSSPISYDDALWWSLTEAGRKVKQPEDKQ